MKTIIKSMAVLLTSLFVLSACGGGGGGGDVQPGPRVAVIGDTEQPLMANKLRQQGFTVDDFSGNPVVRYVVIGEDLVVWVDYSFRATGDIHAYRISTAQQFTVTEQSVDPRGLAVSGNVIVWQDERNSTTGRSDVYGFIVEPGDSSGTEVRLTDGLSNYGSPRLAGQHVVWMDNRTSNLYTCVINNMGCVQAPLEIAAGSGYKRNHRAADNWVVWENETPDGNGIITDIYAYHVETQLVFQVNQVQDSRPSNPQVSGNVIVWSDNRNLNPDIYAYRVTDTTTGAGTEFVIANSSEPEQSPKIDGLWVVWDINRSGDWDLQIARLPLTGTNVVTTDLATGIGTQADPMIKNNVVLWVDRDINPEPWFYRLYASRLSYVRSGIQINEYTIMDYDSSVTSRPYAVWGNQIALRTEAAVGEEVIYSTDYAQSTIRISRDKFVPMNVNLSDYEALVFGDRLYGISDDDVIALYDAADQDNIPMLAIGNSSSSSLFARLAGADRLGLQLDNDSADADMLITVETNALTHEIFNGLDVNSEINLAQPVKGVSYAIELMFDEMHPDAPNSLQILARYSPSLSFSDISDNAPALVELTTQNQTRMLFDVATGIGYGLEQAWTPERWQLIYNELDYLTR